MANAIAIQTRWRVFAALKHEQKMANATTIQAKWRAHAASKFLSQSITNITILQSVVRSWLVRKDLDLERQKMVVTKISACWRSYYAQVAYKHSTESIVVCQSIARRKLATNHMLHLHHEHHVKIATAIQARWKAYLEYKRYMETVRKVVIIQSVFHRNVAVRYLDIHKKAAAKIAATWKASARKVLYQQVILGKRMKAASREH
jgi:myosin heavy subunit